MHNYVAVFCSSPRVIRLERRGSKVTTNNACCSAAWNEMLRACMHVLRACASMHAALTGWHVLGSDAAKFAVAACIGRLVRAGRTSRKYAINMLTLRSG